MVPPIVLGIELCEKAIEEEQTKNVTLINTFLSIWVEDFPSAPEPFVVSVVMTAGVGSVTMDLIIVRLETDEEVYVDRFAVEFPYRLAEIRLLIPIVECSFPAPGKYQFTLETNGEWIAKRDLQVLTEEIEP